MAKKIIILGFIIGSAFYTQIASSQEIIPACVNQMKAKQKVYQAAVKPFQQVIKDNNVVVQKAEGVIKQKSVKLEAVRDEVTPILKHRNYSKRIAELLQEKIDLLAKYLENVISFESTLKVVQQSCEDCSTVEELFKVVLEELPEEYHSLLKDVFEYFKNLEKENNANVGLLKMAVEDFTAEVVAEEIEKEMEALMIELGQTNKAYKKYDQELVDRSNLIKVLITEIRAEKLKVKTAKDKISGANAKINSIPKPVLPKHCFVYNNDGSMMR